MAVVVVPVELCPGRVERKCEEFTGAQALPVVGTFLALLGTCEKNKMF